MLAWKEAEADVEGPTLPVLGKREPVAPLEDETLPCIIGIFVSRINCLSGKRLTLLNSFFYNYSNNTMI